MACWLRGSQNQPKPTMSYFKNLICTAQSMLEYGFSLKRIFAYKEESDKSEILSLSGKIQIIENQYSGTFYLVIIFFI